MRPEFVFRQMKIDFSCYAGRVPESCRSHLALGPGWGGLLFAAIYMYSRRVATLRREPDWDTPVRVCGTTGEAGMSRNLAGRCRWSECRLQLHPGSR
jgi:hypothetical protein